MTDTAAALLVAGPSCVGKDALVSRLLRLRPELAKPVTTTTRPPRPDEVDGVDYHFLSEAGFGEALEKNAFLEHATVHGYRYGLTAEALAEVRQAGRLPVAILDVQGVRSVRALLPVLSVFIRAPIDQIEQRIRRVRPAGQVAPRMNSVRRELPLADRFDYAVDNLDGALDRALEDLVDYYDRIARPRLQQYQLVEGRGTGIGESRPLR